MRLRLLLIGIFIYVGCVTMAAPPPIATLGGPATAPRGGELLERIVATLTELCR